MKARDFPQTHAVKFKARDGLDLVGYLTVPNHKEMKKLPLMRIADFALFYALAILRILTLPRQDVVVCYTTPPFIALVGLITRLFRRSRAVYWVMDLYPDLPIACGVMKPGALPTRFFEGLNRFYLTEIRLRQRAE